MVGEEKDDSHQQACAQTQRPGSSKETCKSEELMNVVPLERLIMISGQRILSGQKEFF